MVSATLVYAYCPVNYREFGEGFCDTISDVSRIAVRRLMIIDEAASILREMYRTARRGDKSVRVVLFGLKYADDLGHLSVQQVILQSGIPRNYFPMVNMGRKLASYVILREDAK